MTSTKPAKSDWWLSAGLPRLPAPSAAGENDEGVDLITWLQAQVATFTQTTLEGRDVMQPWSRASLPSEAKEFLRAVRERHSTALLDAWAAALLGAWLEKIGSGTARRILWVVPAAGLLGADACAALLGPHLRGKNHLLRCRGEVGVTALIEIGTRGALLELAQLAAKCPGRTRGEMAADALLSLANASGLTTDQLQDRILPDGGLDARGERTFDYGPRQFRVRLNEHLQPLLRGPDDRELTTLPKPGAKDDATKAAFARTDWKTAKATIQQSARWLARRFETAMISGESWTTAEFDASFRRHPLAQHVVRRVLWTTTDGTARQPIRFRLAEDDTLADTSDRAITLPQEVQRLRPVHPLELEPAELAEWQKIFSDYQIIGPFSQLDRATYRIAGPQEAEVVITEFPHAHVEAVALVFPLETRGWVREDYLDSGMIQQHRRIFAAAGFVACVEYEPGAFVGSVPESPVQHLRRLFFVTRDARPEISAALPFRIVPAILRSEVLRDLHALVPAP